MKSSFSLRALVAGLGLVTMAQSAQAQRVVVSHDEWLTLNGYFNANERQFVSNAMNWFGVSGGSVLIYSNNGFLADATFQNYLSTNFGVTITNDANAVSFAGYSAVFTGGNTGLNSAALTAYVQGGGNVFYVGGTGTGGPVVEAGYSNPFLNSFGFNFASVYNGIGTVNTSTYAGQGPYGSALFSGVSSVYADNGNTISLTAPVLNVTSQLFSDQGRGVFGAATYGAPTVAPEPASVALMAAGLLAIVPLVRRRRKN